MFENPNIGFYGHNVKYDLHVLANLGIRVARISFDTILASYLLNSGLAVTRSTSSPFNILEKSKFRSNPSWCRQKRDYDGPGAIEKVTEYCCEDVDYTLRLKQLLHPEIIKRKLESLLLISNFLFLSYLQNGTCRSLHRCRKTQ